ncbi:hypothetical protein SAMN02983003_3695 [Devosia enhydra]|uniref:Uncharacterized protein n=1 Tax=Devosia enhydra TaxID=665118 RepID=A0A1K2I2F3_9HYPH|nr:hypothetical protein SAMN02983003_3695 [Devosia enhydra]
MEVPDDNCDGGRRSFMSRLAGKGKPCQAFAGSGSIRGEAGHSPASPAVRRDQS